MSSTLGFSLQVALGALLMAAWFAWPGALLVRLLPGFAELRRGGLLFAPLLGVAGFGPVALLAFHALPYRLATLLGLYAAFNAGLWRLARRRRAGASAQPEPPGGIAPRATYALGALTFALGALPCIQLVPFIHDGALYVGGAIYDHGKVAFLDTIYRHGLPPVSPLLPGPGEPLNLYYAWQFLASQLRVLTGMGGWPADVAFTWLSFAMTLALAAGLAAHTTSSARAGAFAVLLLCAGPLYTLLPQHMLDAPWSGIAEPKGFQPVSVLSAWSPHHLLAADAVVLFLFVVSRTWQRPHDRAAVAFTLAGLFGCAFGCSAWITLSFVLTAPLVAVCAVVAQRPRPSAGSLEPVLANLLWAAPLAAVFCAPVLYAELSGSGASLGFPVAIEPYRTMFWAAPGWVRVLHYWFMFVPLVYGVPALAGLLGLGLPRLDDARERLFRSLCAATVVGFLAVSQWLKSTVNNNDLGWRAQLVAGVLLSVWGGVGVALLSRGRGAPWPGVALSGALGRLRPLLLGLCVVGIVAGLYATPWRPPRPDPKQPPQAKLERRRFVQMERAWALVREHAGPDELVQANPHKYPMVPRWRANLDYLLLADRRSVIGNPSWVFDHCNRTDLEAAMRVLEDVENVFSAEPEPARIRRMRELYRAKALLVRPEDGVWPGDALERSGYYARVHAEPDFRIYVAR